ncbi:MAG: Calx-beta domain-containing protein [Panacibacter sp.]
MRKALLLFVSLISIAIVSFSQPGTLDSSFGVNGKVINPGLGFANCTAIQEDGKILIGGQDSADNCLIARYNSNGTFDSSFGVNGIVLTSLIDKYEIYSPLATVLLIQKDAKILMIGDGFIDDNYYGDYNFVLMRYYPDGTPDYSFGDSGVVISDFFGTTEYVGDASLQNDGKIVVVGQSPEALIIARYNADGSKDPSFGSYGLGYTKNYSSGLGYAIAIQNDGKILAGGASSISSDKCMLARYMPNGTIDSGFGKNGFVYVDLAVAGDFIQDISLLPNGKILATGKAGGRVGNAGSLALIRYLETGALDSSFGTAGIVISEVPSLYYFGRRLLITNNKIVVASESSDFIISGYNLNGQLNEQFASQGREITDMGGNDLLRDAAVQKDNKLILVGTIYGDGVYKSFALARYKNIDPVTISFEKNVRVSEGDAGYTKAAFKIIIDKPSATDISVHLETKNVTAIAGEDYKSVLRKVTIKAGSTSASIEVKINGDSLSEGNEKFLMILSNPVNAITGKLDTAVCTIENDDAGFAVSTAGEDELNQANNLRVYPNPVKDNLQVSGLSATVKTMLTITDLSGNRSAMVAVTGSSYNWNVSRLKAGSYILKIVNGSVVVTKMFVKQ